MYIFCSKALADALNIKKITVYLGANEGNKGASQSLCKPPN